jgi:hypothetical protein
MIPTSCLRQSCIRQSVIYLGTFGQHHNGHSVWTQRLHHGRLLSNLLPSSSHLPSNPLVPFSFSVSYLHYTPGPILLIPALPLSGICTSAPLLSRILHRAAPIVYLLSPSRHPRPGHGSSGFEVAKTPCKLQFLAKGASPPAARKLWAGQT